MKIRLYIKTHIVTGLKYFGKTTRADINIYRGSGTYWLKHIKKHGYHVVTELYGEYNCQETASLSAIKFSIDNNIVDSNEWANLELEDAKNGRAPKYTLEFITSVVMNYINKKDIENDYPGILHCMKSNYGVFDEMTKHMIHSTIKWTKEHIIHVASKYSSKSEFVNQCPGGADAARKLNLWDEVTSHMKCVKKRKYTKEEILEDAKKYNNKTDYVKKSKTAYVARTNGFWEEATNHMSNPAKQIDNIPAEDVLHKLSLCKNKSELFRKYNIYYRRGKQLKII